MTMREFDMARRAYIKRKDDERYMMAMHASWLMNMWTAKGKTITPDKLLGIEKSFELPQGNAMATVKRMQAERKNKRK